jgi:hypothetical protein
VCCRNIHDPYFWTGLYVANAMVICRVGLKQIGAIAPNCSSTHNNTLRVLQRTGFDPAPPKVGHGNLLSMERN